MPLQVLQTYLWPRVTLTFDFLTVTPKVDHFMPLPRGRTTCADRHLFSKYRIHKFGNKRTDGHGRAD